MMNGQQSAALRGGFRHGGVHRPRLDSGVQGIHPGVHQPRRCYCVVISDCVVASGRGGFPKIRPCRWRYAALRPPAYEYRQEGTGNCRGLDPGRTLAGCRGPGGPRQRKGESELSSALSPSCLRNSTIMLQMSKEKVLQHIGVTAHSGAQRSWSGPVASDATRWCGRSQARR